ncbi:uncharacterized protein LOC127807850 isoform X2 [Diospyros lotus]|uniref:uncharacterized protein LOC127807850 isoform X2 n=1 Tax=Diospyros lotus TaxID=55363 RepID=UPI002253D5CA|nr:uncharacterized protein LOC127807850 isoform X2 [Diospyros lotus]
MASATVEPPSGRLTLESIADIDLRFFTQSELYALSLCSDSAFDPRRCDDVVIPKIDRSVFNESAGSRKQTYSRLRLAPRKPESTSPATPSAIPRRTPHLRVPKSGASSADDADPERAENSKIIGLLKELFAAESKGGDLVPVRVEYSDAVPQLPNLGNAVQKRKRGRPRKNENLVVAAIKPEEVVTVKVRAEGDNVVEDRDKEIVNKNGDVVDLRALASLEDPYGAELRRRTENLKTEEELLGFLSELNGYWASRRRKKKIVDANEFGHALPKGWKLVLSLKKKEGRLWLFVRRYISPNGLQFASCKEVSSYLLLFSSPQDANQPNYGQTNESSELTYKDTDVAVKEINERADLVCHSPSIITDFSNDHKKLVFSEVGNSGNIQMGGTLECDKCPMTFSGKDEFLQHQLSSHRRKRSRIGTSITDGVIIKGGQYECQFCHKTFNERNRYNGHVGAHIRHHMKSDEASPGVPGLQPSIDPASSSGVPPKELILHTSFRDNYDAVTFNAKAESEMQSVSAQDKFKAGSYVEESYNETPVYEVKVLSNYDLDSKSDINERSHSLSDVELCTKHKRESEMDNCSNRVGQADNEAAKLNFVLESENAMPENEIDTNGESATSITNDPLVACGGSLEPCPFSPANESACGSEMNVEGDSVSPQKPKPETDSKNISLNFHGNNERGGIKNVKVMHFASPVERFKLDMEQIENKLNDGFCSSSAGPDEVVTQEKQNSGSVACSPVPISNDQICKGPDNINALSTSAQAECNQKRVSETTNLENCCIKDIYSVSTNFVSKNKINPIDNSGNKNVFIGCSAGQPELDKGAITRVDNPDSCLIVPFWKEQLCDVEGRGSAISVQKMQQGQERGSESSSHILSNNERVHGIENHAGNISTRKMENPELEEVQSYKNNLMFNVSDHGLDTQGRSLQFGSLALSGNVQAFAEENITGFCNNTGNELPNQIDGSTNSLLAQSCTRTAFAYNMNSLSSTSIGSPKRDKVQTSSDNELVLAFGNSATVIDDVMNNVPIEQTFGFNPTLCGENNRTGNVPEQQGSLLGLSSYAKPCVGENNSNRVHTSRVLERPMINDAISSGYDKLTIGFGSCDTQSDKDVMPSHMWRTGEANVLQSSPANNSSCLPAFRIISDKGENEFLGGNGKYGSMTGFEGTQSGHTGHVEFSFLTTQNLNSLPGDSKSLSYNTQMGQGFDSSFWLDKDALSLNISSRNLVTSTCVWCRSEFHHEPLPTGTQTSGIGSMCPTCSANVSQRFNVF